MVIAAFLVRCCARLGAILGPSGNYLGTILAMGAFLELARSHLGHLGPILKSPWSYLRTILAIMGPSWAILGPSIFGQGHCLIVGEMLGLCRNRRVTFLDLARNHLGHFGAILEPP